MKNIFKTSLLVVLSCLMASSVWGANSDFTVSLSEFTKTENTYEATFSSAKKVQGCVASIEVPSAAAAGSIGFWASGNYTDRLIYIFGNAGTTADKSRTADMSKIEYKKISFTAADIATENGKYYLKFSSDQDYKFTKVQYTLTSGEEGKSHDATLKSLTYNNGTSVPGFTATKLDYEVELPYGTTNIPEVKAEKNDEKASDPVITQATTLPGTATIVVTPEEGDPKTYTVSFVLAGPSHDATLKEITVNGTPLSDFAPSKTEYTYDVPADFSGSLEVSATKNDANASEPDITQITALPSFNNPATATIKVTAEDGTTTKTYTITFKRLTKYVTVETISFTDQKGTATIVHGDPITATSLGVGTITAQIKYNGDLTAITPSFTGQNIVSWDNKDIPKDFSNGAVRYIISGNGPVSTYDVTITKAPEVLPSEIELNKTELKLTEGGSATLTATVKPDDADNKAYTWESNNTSVATVDADGKVKALTPGTANIIAKTKKGDQTATCTVKVEAKKQSGLITHVPEIYEDSKGYNTPLVQFGNDNREYEVYYIGKVNSNAAIYTKNTQAGHLVSTNNSTTALAGLDNDKWFEGTFGSIEGSFKKAGESPDNKAEGRDEFETLPGDIQLTKDHHFNLQIKGFDQFSIVAKDKKKDTSSDQSKPGDNRYFEIYIDGILQDPQINTDEATTRRYGDLTPDEHFIEIKALGTEKSKFYGFSLRVANTPIVRYISGPKEQTVYQTEAIEQVAYRVRRAKSYQLNWGVGNAGIPGVTAVAGANDSVYIQGIADAPAGTYTYTLEALDENDEVKSSESGTIKIETHIDDCKAGNDITTNVAEEMKPLNFHYYALDPNDITFTCDINGLDVEFDEQTQTATISGTPDVQTLEGEHTYTLAIDGGNTVTGTITIVVPDPIFETIPVSKTKDGEEITFYFVVHHAEDVTIDGLPQGFTVSYDKNNDTVTVVGTPNIGSGYPKTFEYTATATPRYAGKQSTTATGELKVLDPNAKAIMVVTKTLDNIEALTPLQDDEGYDITYVRQSAVENISISVFGVIVISDDVDADTVTVLNLIRKGEKPVLNMKGFTYAAGRLSWGEPDNGTKDTLTNHPGMIYVQNEHKIFNDKTIGDSIQILKMPAKMSGVMPIKVFGDSVPGSYCLATGYTRNIHDYYADGPLETAIHEIPSAKTQGGHKYIGFPLALNSLQYMTDAGRKLLVKTLEYLVDDEETSVIEVPELQINSFSIEGIDAVINQDSNMIVMEMVDTVYMSLDSLRHVQPTVELADPDRTHFTPVSTVDLQGSNLMPYQYFVVSDYIHRRAYEFSLKLILTLQSIEEVYEEGQWVNIYDIYGRLIATTNENIHTMDLPRGIYIAVTENGKSIKLMR